MNIYKNRRANLATWMAQHSIALVFFHDSEASRDPAVRYFCGNPSDAILAISVDGSAVLCPWDEIMAKKMAHIEHVVPYTKYECNPVLATKQLIKYLKAPHSSRIEIAPTTPYPLFLRYVDAIDNHNVVCRENGAHTYVNSLRAKKDGHEVEDYRTVCSLTNSLIDKIEQGVRSGELKTESDVALFIEKECRLAGSEGTSFSTLCAGPERSFGIHCVPPYTNGDFATHGLSILDFGVLWNGYGSDVTLTFARGPLSEEQEEILTYVQKAYDACLPLYVPGKPVIEAAQKAADIFAKIKRKMPHGLGHGMGLEPHEYPRINTRAENDAVFEAGMVVSLEPGLYDSKLGGCRLENTVLITETGNEVLTNSRIIRL